MTTEEHKEAVSTLRKLEVGLIEHVAKGSDELQDAFTKWQNQRSQCNEGYLKWMSNQIDEISESSKKCSCIPEKGEEIGQRQIWTCDNCHKPVH